MMEMNRVYLNDLYDLYNSLLSDHEKLIFEDYYHNDLSLSEIAENESVTRNAIHKSLKTTESKLIDYEKKIKLYEKKNKIMELIENNDIESIKEVL